MRILMLALAIAVGACGAGTDGRKDAAAELTQNERTTVSRLMSVAAAETQAQCLAALDADGDGQGEFAYLSELSGADKGRVEGEGIKIPLLGRVFRRSGRGGFVTAGGYNFRVFLPGEDGDLVAAADGASVSADGAEERWVCYAWPQVYGETGKVTFVVDQGGTVHSQDIPAYSGASGPEGAAAYVPGETSMAPEWRSAE